MIVSSMVLHPHTIDTVTTERCFDAYIDPLVKTILRKCGHVSRFQKKNKLLIKTYPTRHNTDITIYSDRQFTVIERILDTT